MNRSRHSMTFPESCQSDVVIGAVGLYEVFASLHAAAASRCRCSSADSRSNTAARAAGPRRNHFACRELLQNQPGLDDCVGFLRGHRHDERTALRVQPEQPFGLQSQEGLTHRSARHPQSSRDLTLADQFPARKRTGQHLAFSRSRARGPWPRAGHSRRLRYHITPPPAAKPYPTCVHDGTARFAAARKARL